MGIGLTFWILMLIWFAFSLWSLWNPAVPSAPYANVGFLFVLFLLLGWGVFGAPIRG